MRLAIAASLAAVVIAPAFAQPNVQPAPQLAKFERFLGAYEGSGTVYSEPGQPGMPWTSRSHSRKVLNGHFLHDVLEIDFGEAMPTKMLMQSLLGWDRENEKYTGYTVTNLGAIHDTTYHWIDDDTLLTISATVENGEPTLQREMIRFTSTGYDMRIERAVGTGKFHEHVVGTFKRSNVAEASAAVPAPADTAFMFAPPAAEMTSLVRCAGTWDVKGKMIPAPGLPEAPISGTETLKPLYGGHVLIGRVVGDPTPPQGVAYEMLTFTSWNPQSKCYEHCWADNMGGMGRSRGRPEGDAIVFTSEALAYGKPKVDRMVMHRDASGKITRATSDAIFSIDKPVRSFDATYTPSKK